MTKNNRYIVTATIKGTEKVEMPLRSDSRMKAAVKASRIIQRLYGVKEVTIMEVRSWN